MELYPEPKTIGDYQRELTRAWGFVLRVEEKARKLADVSQTALEEVELVRHRANDLIDTINRMKKGSHTV